MIVHPASRHHPARPATLAVAVSLVSLIGAAMLFAGVLLLLVAGGGFGVADLAGGAVGVVALLGIVAILAGAMTLTVAAGLWRGRPWGWAGSLAIGVLALLGAVVALGTGGGQLPLVAGFALTVAAIALLLAPATRSASGIG